MINRLALYGYLMCRRLPGGVCDICAAACPYSGVFIIALSRSVQVEKSGSYLQYHNAVFQRGVSDELMSASDIHGSLPATESACFERSAQSGARWLVILGDVLNHGPRNALPEGYAPACVAERLNAVAATQIIAVRGATAIAK